MSIASFSETAIKPHSMADITPLVYIVDDDISVRESIDALVEQAGWRSETFSSAQDFLGRPRARRPCCLILDIGLPDLDGLEVQRRIAGARAEMPIIFITGCGDIPTTVRAMKAGAAEFLTKPFAPEALVRAIEVAVERSRVWLEENAALQILRDRHQSLSRREKEVMALIVQGQLNKQVGGTLDISEITVKAHRGRMMRKMQARSLPELVNIAARLGLDTASKN
jgi:FixJ family two-component response regulator